MRCLYMLVVLPMTFLLTACGEKTQCSGSFDLRGAIEALRASDGAPNNKMKAILDLSSSCSRFSESHQALISDALKDIGLKAPMVEQMRFFRDLSGFDSSAGARISFIKSSPLFASNQAAEKLSLVDFSNLGRRVTLAECSEVAKVAFKNQGLNLEQLASEGSLREVVDGGGRQKLLLAKVNDSWGRFVETSYIAAFSESTGQTLSFPSEQLNLVGLRQGAGHYLEYFFSCQDMAGDVCAVRDSRYLINTAGELRYVVQVNHMADEQEERCDQTVSVGEFKGGGYAPIAGAALKSRCSSVPTSEGHVLPFTEIDDVKLLESLRLRDDSQVGKLSLLINFSRRDTGDEALLRAVLNQGGWPEVLTVLSGMATRPANMGSLDTGSLLDGVGQIQKYLGDVERLMGAAEWLAKVSGKPMATDEKLKASSEKVKAAILLFKERLARIDLPRPPEKPSELQYPTRAVTLILQREVFPEERVVALPDLPVRYVAVEMGRQRLIILYSEKRLADRPGMVSLNVLTGLNDKPSGTFTNRSGFTQDYWSYSVLTEEQAKALNEYSQANLEFKKRIGNASVELRELDPSVTAIAQAVGSLLQGIP